MPYCTSCGSQVAPNAAYCATCGRPQQRGARAGAGPTMAGGPFDEISPKTAAVLCYLPVVGVIPAIIILASKRFRGNVAVRFDAFQSVYLFVAFLIVNSAFPILFFGSGFGVEHGLFELFKLGIVICWIVLLVKAAQNQQVHLPVIGDLAARSANEQL